MRKFLFMGLLLVGLGANAQTNEATASVPSKGLNILQEKNLSYAEFELVTNADFLDYMKSEAAKYTGYFVFETSPKTTGIYTCKMGFMNITAVPQNFHKMFMALGITKIKVDGKVMPVNELLNLK